MTAVEQEASAEEARATRLAGVAVAALLGLAYLATLPPGLTAGDGPELAAAAWCFGVPHPTGYPLYMMLLGTWGRLLPAAIEWIARCALFSSVCLAAAGGLSVLIGTRLVGFAVPAWPAKARILTAAAAALTFGFFQTVWENATLTEVYAFQHLLTAVFFYLSLRFVDEGRVAQLAGLAVVAGLALAHHRLSLGLLVTIAILPWLSAIFVSRRGPRAWWLSSAAACAGAVVLGALLYLYIPVRAAADPPVNWGNARTTSALIEHARGTDYIHYRLLRPAPGHEFTARLYVSFAGALTAELADVVGRQIVPGENRSLIVVPGIMRYFQRPTEAVFVALLLLGFAVAGIAALARRDWRVPVLFVPALGLNFAVIYAYNIADISDYLIYPLWCLVLAAFAGAAAAVARIRAFAPAAAAAALLILPAATGALQAPQAAHASDLTVEEFAAMILPDSEELMPRGSVLLTGGDTDIFCAWYKQIVRGERTDVLVFGSNFIHRTWYPAFFPPERIAAYGLIFAEGTPLGPEAFAEQLVTGVIEPNLGRVAVFTTLRDLAVLQLLAKRYSVKPVDRGLFRTSRLTRQEQEETLWQIERKMEGT